LARAKDLELMQVIALTEPLNRQAWCSIGSDQRSRRRRRHPGITLLFSKCLATHYELQFAFVHFCACISKFKSRAAIHTQYVFRFNSAVPLLVAFPLCRANILLPAGKNQRSQVGDTEIHPHHPPPLSPVFQVLILMNSTRTRTCTCLYACRSSAAASSWPVNHHLFLPSTTFLTTFDCFSHFASLLWWLATFVKRSTSAGGNGRGRQSVHVAATFFRLANYT
jgi:hypothetical protein